MDAGLAALLRAAEVWKEHKRREARTMLALARTLHRALNQ